MSERFPLDPKPGDHWKQWEYKGEPDGWVCADAGAGEGQIASGGGIAIGPIAPANPGEGNLWFDGSILRVWNGSAWVQVVSGGGQGPQGPQGQPGTPGAQGAQGQQGPAGPQGIQGAQGQPGQGITVKGTVPTESELPANASPGDLYLDEDTGHGWVWSGTQWIDIGQLASDVPGPAGQQGPQGAQGPAGAASTVPGPAGPAGAAGSQGPAGGQGPAGPPGATGATGAIGPAGPTTLASITGTGLGSFLQAYNAATVYMYSANAVSNIAALYLPGGDWDVTAEVQVNSQGWSSPSFVFIQAGLSPNSSSMPGTYPANVTMGLQGMMDGKGVIMPIAPRRYQGAQWVYLNAYWNLPPSYGAPSYFFSSGVINARRWG